MTLSKNLFAAVAAVSLASFASAQYATSTIPGAFNDISATGTDLGIVSDDGGVTTPLGFTFDFFGSAITEIGVSSNGYLTDGGSLSDFSNDCIPSTSTPHGRISPFQGDFSPNIGGTIYSELAGAPGSQSLTVQWDGVPNFGNSTSSFTFQATLFEADDSIEFQYGTFVAGTPAEVVDGSEQSVGIENQTGTVGFEISCNAAFDTSMGYRFELPSIAPPALTAPGSACLGDTITLSGTGEPGHFYAIAVSGSNGPTAFGPISLDLGPDYVDNIVGLGVIDGGGATAPTNVYVPPAIGCGFTGYSQMVTLTFGPVDNVQKSSSEETTFTTCQTFVGSLDSDATTSDHYSFSATAGDVVTITMCRLEDTPGGGCSGLDPRVCLYDAPGFVGTGIASGDDNLGDCYFPGCTTGLFSAGGILNFTIPADGTYEIAASGWGGTSGAYELMVQGCTGTVSAVADEAAGGCF